MVGHPPDPAEGGTGSPPKEEAIQAQPSRFEGSEIN